MKRFIDFVNEENGTYIAAIIFLVVAMASMIPIWYYDGLAIPSEEEWSLAEEKIIAVCEHPELLLQTDSDVKIDKEVITVTLPMDKIGFSVSARFDKNFVLLSNPTRNGVGTNLVERIFKTFFKGVGVGAISYVISGIIISEVCKRKKKVEAKN